MYQDVETKFHAAPDSETDVASNGVFMRRLTIPLGLLLATFALVGVTLTTLAVANQNRIAARDSAHLAISAFRSLESTLTAVVASHAHRDASHGDARPADVVIAALLDNRYANSELHKIGLASILNAEGYAIAFASSSDTPSYRLRNQFATAASALAEHARRHGPEVHVPSHAYIRVGDTIYLAAADTLGKDRNGGVLILAKEIDANLLARLESDYLLRGLRYSGAEHVPGTAKLALKGLDNRPLATLEWRTNQPGELVKMRLIVPLTIAFAISVTLTWLIIRRAQSGAQAIDETADQLAIANRQLSESASREREARHQAEAAANAKSEFLAVVSHELRTPLNAIIGFSEIIRDEVLGKLGDHRYREYAIDIYTSGVHLLSLLNDILDLSKAEAGKLELREETVDVTDVIERALRMVSPQAQAAELDIVTEIEDALPYLWADERKIRQILINLMSNSLKFTPPGGRIGVGGAMDDDRLRIWVQDSGIGIAPEHVDKALQPFGQVDSALSRQHDGTGLGLPLVKRLVELHGAEFVLTSALGEGTKISMVFAAERVVKNGDDRGPDDLNTDQRLVG